MTAQTQNRINNLVMMYGMARVYATINSVYMFRDNPKFDAAVNEALDNQFRN